MAIIILGQNSENLLLAMDRMLKTLFSPNNDQ